MAMPCLSIGVCDKKWLILAKQWNPIIAIDQMSGIKGFYKQAVRIHQHIGISIDKFGDGEFDDLLPNPPSDGECAPVPTPSTETGDFSHSQWDDIILQDQLRSIHVRGLEKISILSRYNHKVTNVRRDVPGYGVAENPASI